ncbi:MAG: protein translocase subunit SecF [Hyphomicrobiales bacterium]|nr:protein translocase subunit SecF [Hyphomicrobiales bacterium]
MFKPLRLVPDDTKYRFMRLSRPAVIGSAVACVLSIVLFAVVGLNYGIDFKGGTIVEVRSHAKVADIASLRSKVGGLGLGEIELQEFGDPRDVLIKFESQEGGDLAQQEAIKKVRGAVASTVDIRRIEVVGPKVSGELKQQSSIAVLMAIVAVMVYIWFRFEWQFAIGAVSSLTHDVILTIGLFSILGIEFNLTIIAAILTIVGYSLNDTVVVYDRVRENLRKYKKMSLSDLIDMSLNQMLPRTVLTSLSTLLALLALYIFGGEVIRGFTFAMIWGVFIGTYSSIFVAAPVLIYMGARIDQSSGPKAEEDAVEPATP